MLQKIHPRANVLLLLVFLFSVFDHAMANCLENWISNNIDAEAMTNEILEVEGCTVAGFTLPNSLTTMTNLKQISLDRSELAGNITDAGWETLNQLTVLSLRYNDITGSIPKSLGSVTKLEQLMIEGNKLTSSIPSELGSPSNLFIMSLDNNKLTGSIPEELGSLSELVYITLYDNRFHGGLPTFVRVGVIVGAPETGDENHYNFLAPRDSCAEANDRCSWGVDKCSDVGVCCSPDLGCTVPSSMPTNQPTKLPTFQPTNQPTKLPTFQPTNVLQPTLNPTMLSTLQPTILPTFDPTWEQTLNSTSRPTVVRGPSSDSSLIASIVALAAAVFALIAFFVLVMRKRKNAHKTRVQGDQMTGNVAEDPLKFYQVTEQSGIAPRIFAGTWRGLK